MMVTKKKRWRRTMIDWTDSYKSMIVCDLNQDVERYVRNTALNSKIMLKIDNAHKCEAVRAY